MPRVGVLTFHYAGNYGAVCQAVALQMAIRQMGAETEIIDYEPACHLNDITPAVSIKTKAIFRRTLSAISRRMSLANNGSASHAAKLLKGKCRKFIRENAQLSSISYSSASEIENTPPQYDCYIVGSDQIWNPYNIGVLRPYLLNFVASGKKIAYAASMGAHEWREWKEELRQRIETFHAVSLRESRTRDELAAACSHSIDIAHCVDPIFLAPDFLSIGRDDEYVKRRRYVCNYFLSGGADNRNYALQKSRAHAKDNEYDIVTILPHEGYMTINNEKSELPDVPYFIWLLCNSARNVTNSFHGVALSLISGTECLPVSRGGMGLDVRILDLMNRAGLCSVKCLYSKRSLQAESHLIRVHPRGIGSHGALGAWIDDSVNWLRGAIYG